MNTHITAMTSILNELRYEKHMRYETENAKLHFEYTKHGNVVVRYYVHDVEHIACFIANSEVTVTSEHMPTEVDEIVDTFLELYHENRDTAFTLCKLDIWYWLSPKDCMDIIGTEDELTDYIMTKIKQLEALSTFRKTTITKNVATITLERELVTLTLYK